MLREPSLSSQEKGPNCPKEAGLLKQAQAQGFPLEDRTARPSVPGRDSGGRNGASCGARCQESKQGEANKRNN